MNDLLLIRLLYFMFIDMEELTIVLKNWKELNTTKYSKENFEELQKAICDGEVKFLTFNNVMNWSVTIIRVEDISAILYMA